MAIFQLKDAFWMPLDADDPTVPLAFVCFDQPGVLVGNSGWGKERGQGRLVHTLMVIGVDLQSGLADDLAQTAAGQKINPVISSIARFGPMAVKVLHELAAGRDIEHLTTAADGEDRHVLLQGSPAQIQLQLIAWVVNRVGVRAVEWLAEIARVNIPPPEKMTPSK